MNRLSPLLLELVLSVAKEEGWACPAMLLCGSEVKKTLTFVLLSFIFLLTIFFEQMTWSDLGE
jgi:hypothetical protein